jgi:hypothetical protein
MKSVHFPCNISLNSFIPVTRWSRKQVKNVPDDTSSREDLSIDMSDTCSISLETRFKALIRYYSNILKYFFPYCDQCIIISYKHLTLYFAYTFLILFPLFWTYFYHGRVAEQIHHPLSCPGRNLKIFDIDLLTVQWNAPFNSPYFTSSNTFANSFEFSKYSLFVLRWHSWFKLNRVSDNASLDILHLHEARQCQCHQSDSAMSMYPLSQPCHQIFPVNSNSTGLGQSWSCWPWRQSKEKPLVCFKKISFPVETSYGSFWTSFKMSKNDILIYIEMSLHKKKSGFGTRPDHLKQGEQSYRMRWFQYGCQSTF